ncbi:MAG: hypothetical protein K5886_13100 [Lachnospiraceae bacterium]|nr:hypothetical protein [Lachnospiraceae bacterium]
MENYRELLIQQEKLVNELLVQTEKHLRTIRIKEDRKVKIIKRKHVNQYYLVDNTGKRVYVRKKDEGIVQKILQRDYYIEVSKKLSNLSGSLRRFLKTYDIDSILKVYDSMSEARRELIRPILPSDEEYIIEWMERNKGGKNTFPEQGMFLTNKGEYVRSKSEKILADLFLKHGIPYSYEPEFITEDHISLYPDFVVLNVKRRKTIYWEHFGLITDGEYARKNLQKLNKYERSGLEIGKNLVFSMESETEPLNVKEVEKKIKRYCLA